MKLINKMKKSKAQIEYEKKFNKIVKKLHGEKACIPKKEPKSQIVSKSPKNKYYNKINKKEIKNNDTIPVKEEENKFKLYLHKCFDSFLGKINIPINKNIFNLNSSLSNTPKMIIILDISGSMCEQVERFIQRIIPDILNDIYGTNSSYSIGLITFSSFNCVKFYEGNSVQISRLIDIFANGATYMSCA